MPTKSKKTTAKKNIKTKKTAIKSSSKTSAKSPAKKSPSKKISSAKKVMIKKQASAKGSIKKSKVIKQAPKKGLITKFVEKLTSKKVEKKSPKSEQKSSQKITQKVPDIKASVASKNDKSKIVKNNLKSEDKIKSSPTSDGKKISKIATSQEIKSSGSKKSSDVKGSSQNVAELTQDFAEKKLSSAPEIFLTDAEGRVLCKYSGCDEIAAVEGYCRYHYLLNWKRIQLKKKILTEGKLDKYIHELTAKYPDKYVEMLKGDLKTEKDFTSVVNELEIDDTDSSMSEDDDDGFEEVQGVASGKRSSEEDY